MQTSHSHDTPVLQTDLFSKPQRQAMVHGMNCTTYRYLGAHPMIQDGVSGTRFAVWAPNAREVCVLNEANAWSHGGFYLNGSNEGVWSGFIPGVAPGEVYKYSIRTQTGNLLEKSDPYAFAAELPPRTGSIVTDLTRFQWQDQDWMDRRQQFDWLHAPISIYEVQLASWKRPWDGRKYHSYAELAELLVEYCHEMGYTHLELMPITEYPFDGSWGYQTTGYFAPTSRFGGPEDFQKFVDTCHRNGIGVIIDWVPAHFPTDAHSIGRFDGTALYEHEDARKGFHPDWNTFIFNYGRNEVRNFLLSSARFWCDMYHIDGLRVDAVASMLYLDYSRKEGEWIPNAEGGRENLEAISFLRDFNSMIHAEFPGAITLAEESTSWGGVSRPLYDGGLGFSMKWDMGWMNDTLKYFRRNPLYRAHHQNELSFRMMYAFTENFVLPLSHDEVVHMKGALIEQMPGDDWQKFANLRLLYGYQYTTPGKPLLFMSCEFAQRTEWNHDQQLDWGLLQDPKHAGIRQFVGDMNRVLREQPALYDLDFEAGGFAWIHADDAAHSVYSWCRYSRSGELLVVMMNMTPVPRQIYRVGVPRPGHYAEIINSDSHLYGGTDVGNLGGLNTEPVAMHSHSQSLQVVLPPLGMLILKHQG
ncbi:MAG: 1,4-alpha-glucan branching protein GlgB [Planctomycetaceae bacterium]